MQRIQQKHAKARASRASTVSVYVGNTGHRKHPKLWLLQMVPAATQEQMIQAHGDLGSMGIRDPMSTGNLRSETCSQGRKDDLVSNYHTVALVL